MPEFSVIIPAAGASRRFQGRGCAQKKPFVELDGRAIWLRTVDHFLNRSDVVEIIVVIAADDMDEFTERFRPNLAFMEIQVVAGGATRAESVANGLAALKKSSDFVAVHDAARPLLTKPLVDSVFKAAEEHGAVIPAVAVTSTVKRVDDSGQIQQTVDRSRLRLAQTPQVFRRNILEQAFVQVTNAADFTDEASLVEAFGHPVFVCPGAESNIKITTTEDFELAGMLLKQRLSSSKLRDLHPFGDERFR